jgi:hypothetical protein
MTNIESFSRDASNSRDSMDGHSRKAIENDRVDIRNIMDANSSRDAFTASGTPATIATPQR